ncbi:MAG: tRNA threonylcarbamoyladenosine dehydratase [Burkholderiales bacterium]
MNTLAALLPPDALADDADLERRFGGLRRLWGEGGYQRVRQARFAVVGLGGVGSWAAEALARCGVAELVLIDLDHVAESNINRQVQALGATIGAAKAQALKARIADIHPGCKVWTVEEFVDAGNWPGLLPVAVDGVIDACDQTAAKFAMACWAIQGRHRLVVAGAAGGKSLPHRIEVEDLALATHDPLLASLRQRLRKAGVAAKTGAIGVRCVFSREPVAPPAQAECAVDGSLNCHGYGSVVTVTASFGMAAAAEALRCVREPSAG